MTPIRQIKPAIVQQTLNTNRDMVFAFLGGMILVLVAFVWEGHQGFNLWDEGYLWYGVQRSMLGEVPLRDFQAYDPARYYWCALLMKITGSQGIMAVRATVAVLQALALGLALTTLASAARGRRNGWFLLICGISLLVWMVPRHKLFDIAISIALVCTFARWIRVPSVANSILAGMVVGIAACLGRNHGVYGLAAGAGIGIYLSLRCEGWRRWSVQMIGFGAGVVIGYLPIVFMMIFVSGFYQAFIESIRFLFEVKATNLPLPIPWPWTVDFSALPLVEAYRQVLLGLFFMTTLVFGVFSILHVVARRLRGGTPSPLLVACAFLALPYAHYAFSRADAGHLALGIFPTLIGCMELASSLHSWRRMLTVCVLALSGVFTMIASHPGWQCRSSNACTWISIGDDRLYVDATAASNVGLLYRLRDSESQGPKNFFAAPFWPGAYALLGRRSPTWEIYTAWPRSDEFQRREITDIERSKPAFVVIYDLPLDGHDELRYAKTHPLIDAYVRTNFNRTQVFSDDPALQIYLPRTTP
ncbi:hypothetical protein [Dyella sp. GSA-30]|uniref:hypothetical protein n=1 Tax=Dyella sp. GSA-30 TaxID=2994496 RepID=UPI0024925CC4|nr:hypothetical protein [Dyella sp. GSA-30]BDU20212.1 hypothetical protein DYGSA30_16690 [Dyella sp. GSA-30]